MGGNTLKRYSFQLLKKKITKLWATATSKVCAHSKYHSITLFIFLLHVVELQIMHFSPARLHFTQCPRNVTAFSYSAECYFTAILKLATFTGFLLIRGKRTLSE